MTMVCEDAKHFGAGVLKLFGLPPPNLFLEIPRPFKKSCNSLDIKILHTRALIWDFFGQTDKKFSISNFVDPFLKFDDPRKGRDS